MNNNATELSVSIEVLEKMAELATMEVDGVVGVSKKAMDLKNAVKTKTPFKGVKAENLNGAIKITVYICVAEDAAVKEVSEKVQKNVKEKIQTMTNTAVTSVDVVVADLEFKAETTDEQ